MSQLPIASFTQVRAFARVLLTRHRGSIALMLAFYAVAAIAALGNAAQTAARSNVRIFMAHSRSKLWHQPHHHAGR